MDIVFIEQLCVMTTIGVYDWEQRIRQKLIFDIEIGSDNRKAAASDDVKDCLNYAEISEAVLQHVEKNSFALVERVAEEVAELLLTRFPSSWVRIKVSKSNAVPQAKHVGVIIERRSCSNIEMNT
ncbi:bifunctional dihydroneopterin aldolase/7,8-dihydroneopterin epimerase [Candidatus Fukatsuia symbiotica]|uniref:7,8-dihydroneopterin aldolase n=1 Tax=Candidatus Fukatsuia symbiotica TaxID=1878942 RepID=A0A2U8I596_9GAMM|nr:bifunctional dihydroneopterin aldolase/7,8-dihydroneopterin epimerase [Candidatus Fukatsuia symbiotica]AWK14327.1 bifunctional dihydroneopterin aldolase/7,8-dihydroneopterin epimerase [Candidatus Fukatsuia symbiotica]MEA9444587.1 bifunctional dihydroneopterin aldolase/7,8-dihydroneopterin epimerase [Candidatus Fukatsuia symbiotica]